jgi:hypothetical protein
VATESVDLKVTLDVRQAQQALDQVRNSAKQLGGEKESLNKQLLNMKERLEKGAGAFAALSLAMGNTNDTAGKVLSSVGQLAAAYGAGGPLALGLAAGASAVSALTKHWDDLIKKQDEAIAKQYAASDAILARSQSITNELRRLTGADQVDRATAIRSDISTAEAQRQAAAMRMAQLTGPARDAEYQEIDRLNKLISAMQNDLRKLEQIQKINKPKPAGKTDGPKLKYGGYDSAGMEAAYSGDTMSAERRQELDKMEEEGLRGVLQVKYQQRLDAAKEHHAKLMDEAKQAAEMEKQLVADVADMKKRYDQEEQQRAKMLMAERVAQANQIGGLASQLAAASAQAAVAGIAGQEKAFEAFVASASAAIGGFITLKGGELLAVGITSTLAGNVPMGAAQIAGGIGLVAAGAAVQAGGPAAVERLMGQAGGSAASGEAARTRGTGGGSRASSGGGSGGTVINISYNGISGPSADDGARALTRATRRAHNRGMLRRDSVMP